MRITVLLLTALNIAGCGSTLLYYSNVEKARAENDAWLAEQLSVNPPDAHTAIRQQHQERKAELDDRESELEDEIEKAEYYYHFMQKCQLRLCVDGQFIERAAKDPDEYLKIYRQNSRSCKCAAPR